jgi:hypothetical protein
MIINFREKEEFVPQGSIYLNDNTIEFDLPEGKVKDYFQKGFPFYNKKLKKVEIITAIEPEKYLLAMILSHMHSTSIILEKEDRDNLWMENLEGWGKAFL